ncbi:hypothetical protein RvY_16730 [Ramazzottius varieornatus]|uniref:Uncharacterized protein n=1 Tax=Ramazzottius varieornatus TaxID=947166 RepID=A0A1D1W248_RAMVA|nr:hypothetical protein RvY_16730 [Ramazzottius varieornatus]
MDVVIEQPISPSLPDVSTLIHHMPCNIAHSGEASVSDFFLTTIDTEEAFSAGVDGVTENDKSLVASHHFSASFRGRPLNGTQLDLRPNYTGLILEQSSKENRLTYDRQSSEESRACNTWKPVAKFQSLTYWNWDKKPSNDDSIQQMLQWARLSEALSRSARGEQSHPEHFVDSDTES